MRTLLILRHGQAAPEEAGSDRSRPLTKRGIQAAERVGHLLRDDDLVPDRIISSNALRGSWRRTIISLVPPAPGIRPTPTSTNPIYVSAEA